jgi:hypothetical protein
MAQFIYTGGHRKDAPKYTKLFDVFFELNGRAMTIDNEFYAQKLRGNASFVELDDSLIIKRGRPKKAEDVIGKPDDKPQENVVLDDVEA